MSPQDFQLYLVGWVSLCHGWHVIQDNSIVEYNSDVYCTNPETVDLLTTILGCFHHKVAQDDIPFIDGLYYIYTKVRHFVLKSSLINEFH